jgi:hypothetical protein
MEAMIFMMRKDKDGEEERMNELKTPTEPKGMVECTHNFDHQLLSHYNKQHQPICRCQQ